MKLQSLNVDGGAAANSLLMQFQSDMLQVPVVKPVIMETTSLGVAFCAGLAIDVWKDLEEIKKLWSVDTTFVPKMSLDERDNNFMGWKKAVLKSLDTIDGQRETTEETKEQKDEKDVMNDDLYPYHKEKTEIQDESFLGIRWIRRWWENIFLGLHSSVS